MGYIVENNFAKFYICTRDLDFFQEQTSIALDTLGCISKTKLKCLYPFHAEFILQYRKICLQFL